eukprot:m.30608 g.30608  ORF g.30608 m.30608 type:complete len:811 (-) comp8218_c0_seq1:49-2481(-)
MMLFFAFTLLALIGTSTAENGYGMPNGHAWGCKPGNISAHLPFCDPTLSIKDRLADLIGRLSTDEKIGLMCSDNHTFVGSCNMMSAGCVRLGIPPYMHLVETNTAVASTCLGPGKCSVNYPGPMGLGATFNRTLWHAKGEYMGNEMRAFNNLQWWRATADAPHSLIGLNGYGPNMNIGRDPRYGRISELPGEDPFLTGTYAVNMVRGGQGMDEFASGKSKFLKMTMGLKHYALYNVEVPRPKFIPNVNAHDLWETYLAQYDLGFSATDDDGNPAGNAMGTMCSYAGLNGVPSCANDYLLNQVIRSKEGFNRPDVVVGTDCGAVNNMVHANHYAKDDLHAASETLNGGTDMELGDTTWTSIANGGKGMLLTALNQGLVNETRLNESVERILNLRFVTGQFDPIEDQPYTKIGAEAVNASEAHQLNLEAALQSFVLLKNDKNTLPFTKGKKTAVLGPHVNSTRDLMSDYKGDEQCPNKTYTCFPTIAEAFTAANGMENTIVEEGVKLSGLDASGIEAALNAASSSEQVLLFIGDGNEQEHEGIDRPNISLPGLQEMFTLKVLQLCESKQIPVAVILINGGPIAIDPIVPAANAIVEAFNPSVRGAEALTIALFGEANRFGKLPITMYEKDFMIKSDFHDFDMSKPPGRTYKYYTGHPLYTFGHGISYSTFSSSCKSANKNADTLKDNTIVVSENMDKVTIDCTVAISGGMASGEEVLMVFHSVGDAIRKAANHSVPLKELVGFDRVHATTSQSASTSFVIGPNQLGLVDENGDKQLIKGDHTIVVTNGVDFSATFPVTVETSALLKSVPKMP